MSKTVQNPFPPAQPLNSRPVILLIQEKPCFLSILYIYDILNPIFFNLYLRIKRSAEKSLKTLHPLLQPYLGITSLINSPYLNPVPLQYPAESIQNHSLKPVNSQRQGLHHKHIRKLIHHQPGKPVRLTEYHPAAPGIHRLLPILPRIFHPLLQKSFIDYRPLFPRKKPHRNLRLRINKPNPQKIPVKIMNRNQIPIFKITGNTFYFIIINPHPPGFQSPPGPFF